MVRGASVIDEPYYAERTRAYCPITLSLSPNGERGQGCGRGQGAVIFRKPWTAVDKQYFSMNFGASLIGLGYNQQILENVARSSPLRRTGPKGVKHEDNCGDE